MAFLTNVYIAQFNSLVNWCEGMRFDKGKCNVLVGGVVRKRHSISEK